MKDVYEIRRENLRAIVGERFDGVAARAADAFGFQQAGYIYRLLANDPKSAKPIGAKLARKIEKIGGKPLNWLDTPHYRATAAGALMLAQETVPRRVPLIKLEQAALWKTTQAVTVSEWSYTSEYAGDNVYALRVPGDSMTSPGGEESFPEGTIIVLDPEREAKPGDFVVAKQNVDGDLTFKQLVRDAGRLYLKPLNPQYPTIELGPDAFICGVLIQSTRVHRRQ